MASKTPTDGPGTVTTITVAEALKPRTIGPTYRLTRGEHVGIIPWHRGAKPALNALTWHTPILYEKHEYLITSVDRTRDFPSVYGVQVEAVPGSWNVIGGEMSDSRSDDAPLKDSEIRRHSKGGYAVDANKARKAKNEADKVDLDKKPRAPAVKLLLLQVKSEQFNTVANRLRLPERLRDDYFDHGEYADIELWVTNRLEIVRARFIPRG